MKNVFNAQETATILAALRYYQNDLLEDVRGTGQKVGRLDSEVDPDGALNDIATNQGELEALTPAEVDELCERINQADGPQASVMIYVSGGVVTGARGDEEDISIDVFDADNITDDLKNHGVNKVCADGWAMEVGESPSDFWERLIAKTHPHVLL